LGERLGALCLKYHFLILYTLSHTFLYEIEVGYIWDIYGKEVGQTWDKDGITRLLLLFRSEYSVLIHIINVLIPDMKLYL